MAREVSDRKNVVRRAVIKIGGQCPARRIPPPVSQFRLQNAGSAGAEKQAHTLRAVSGNGRAHRILKTVLHQTQHGEPVVAAIETRQGRGQLHRIHSGHLADIGLQINGIKRAGRQPAAGLTQGIQCLLKTAADAAGGRKM